MIQNLDIDIIFSWSPALFFISTCIVIGFTFWIYRRTIPPVSGILRGLLFSFRTGALILVCFVAFGPILRLTFKENRKAFVGLLVDASSSMQITDNGKLRGETLRGLLSTPDIVSLQSRYHLQPYLLSDRTIPVQPLIPDSIFFEGNATDIAQALQTLREYRGESYLGGILLISDGNHNSGEDPLRVARDFNCPIFTVTIGESRPKPDLLLSQVLTNDITYVGNQVPVEVSIRGVGFGGRRISVRLHKDGEVLDQNIVTIPPDGLEISLQLLFTPQEQGFQKMTVDISRLGGEVTHINNTHEFYIRVLKSKLKVLLLADAPSPDLAFLKRLLSTDENIHLIVRTQREGTTFYEGRFPALAETKTVDLLILMDVPSHTSHPSIWARVVEMVQRDKKPFLLVLGKRADPQKFTVIETFLPFQLPQKVTESLVIPRFTNQGMSHPVLRIDENWETNSAIWHTLPPLFSAWKITDMKPGCQILVTGIYEKGSLPTFSDNHPLIFARHVGSEKSLAILGQGLFRWDLLMWGTGGSNVALKGFMGNTVRWLVTREEDKPVRISTNKTIYRSGEEILLTAQVNDETYKPQSDAFVTAKLRSPSGESNLQLIDAGAGRYKKTFRVFESGEYHVEVEAVLQERSLGRDTIEFSVSSFNPEFLDTRASPELMENLARITGGQFGTPDSLSSIIQAMNFPQQTVHSLNEIELYNFPWTLIVIALLLSAEWFIRKRKGMV